MVGGNGGQAKPRREMSVCVCVGEGLGCGAPVLCFILLSSPLFNVAANPSGDGERRGGAPSFLFGEGE